MDIVKFVDSKVWWPENQGYKMDDAEIRAMQDEIIKIPNCRMLQIGTNYGWTVFNVLKQLDAVGGAIDTIDFMYPKKAKQLKRTMKWISHFRSVLKTYNLNGMIRYYVEGSDHFFKHSCDTYYDVIFIDGDHSFKQSNRDLMNSIKVLRDKGVIFIHDVRKSRYLGKKSCLKTFNEFQDDRFTKTLLDTKYKLGVLKLN